MTTETEPMVRVVAVIAECCGVEVSAETSPRWGWQPMEPNVLRMALGNTNWFCDPIAGGCGKRDVSVRVATEPVR